MTVPPPLRAHAWPIFARCLSQPLNFIPEEPVRAHLAKLATGETVVWGAFQQDELVGFITGEVGGGYWLQTGAGEGATCFINEFVVKPGFRGKRIGVNLTSLSVHPSLGIFGINPEAAASTTNPVWHIPLPLMWQPPLSLLCGR